MQTIKLLICTILPGLEPGWILDLKEGSAGVFFRVGTVAYRMVPEGTKLTVCRSDDGANWRTFTPGPGRWS